MFLSLGSFLIIVRPSLYILMRVRQYMRFFAIHTVIVHVLFEMYFAARLVHGIR